MSQSLRVLIIEDDDGDFILLRHHLQHQSESVVCSRVDSREELAVALDAGTWDVVLSDYYVDGLEFRETFDLIRRRSDLPVILVSGNLGEEEAVEWLKRGVADFVVKNHFARLMPAIERARRDWAERLSRQAAEEALRQSRKMLRFITDALPALISYVDSEFRYRQANRCYERWVGKRPEEIVGQPVWDVLGKAAWETIRPYMERALTGEQVNFEAVVPYQLAGPRWVRVSYTPEPADETGRVPGFVILVQDIDESKQTELLLESHKARLEEEVAARTAQLEATNQELQAFTYAVSHDLKAPLRSINAFSSLLERSSQGCLEGESLEFLARIRQSVGRMNSLVDDLLDYAKVEQRTLQARSVDLASAVQAILAEKSEEIRKQAAVLQVDVPATSVRADPDGLAQVLRNLIDNALKFSAGAEPPVIEIGTRTVEDGCYLWVRDNGIGFNMAQHERIFEIFQRLHSIEEFPGTGIGLALIKKAMERMGGRVWAESAPGQGATFFLVLPPA